MDDIDELAVYGRGDRVRMLPRATEWQEMVITVHWKQEIDTDAFREFLKEAGASDLSMMDKKANASIEDHSPWKVLGKKWHLMRKGVSANKNPKSKAEVLEALVTNIESAVPGIAFDWTERQFVHGKRSTDDADLFRISTKRRVGLDFTLFVAEGSLALGRIATLGVEREIKPHKDGRDAVLIRFTQLGHVGGEVSELLKSLWQAE